MKAYHFNFEKAIEENGFYTRDAFFEVSDIEIRLLYLSTLLVNTELPFEEFSYGVFKKYEKIVDLCVEALNSEKNNHLNDKSYFKLHVFKEVIDCVVMKACFRYIQSFSNARRLKSNSNGNLVDKNGNTILNIFRTWQGLTGVWIPVTLIGKEFALSFDDRVNSFRPIMGWEIKNK